MKAALALILVTALPGLAQGGTAIGIIDTDRPPTATATQTRTQTQTQPNTAPRTETRTVTSTSTSTSTLPGTSPTKPSGNASSSDLGERAAGAKVEFTFGHGRGHVIPKEHNISGASSVPEWMLKAAGLLPAEREEEPVRGQGVASAQ